MSFLKAKIKEITYSKKLFAARNTDNKTSLSININITYTIHTKLDQALHQWKHCHISRQTAKYCILMQMKIIPEA